MFDLGSAGPWEVNENMTLIQYSPRISSAGRQMVSQQAGNFKVSPDLQHLIRQVINSSSDLFVGQNINIVKDHDRIGKLLYRQWIFINRAIRFGSISSSDGSSGRAENK